MPDEIDSGNVAAKVPTADAPCSSGEGVIQRRKSAPLTAAQRQKRHREKRKAAFAELLAQATAANGPVAMLQRENASLRSALDVLQRKHAEQAATLRDVKASQPAERGQQEVLRQVIRTLLARLSPASGRMARRHLTEAGFIQWLDAD